MDGWWIASYIVLWILVVTLSVVVVALARQIGTLHLRLGPRGALEIDDEGPVLGEVLAADTRTAIDGSLIEVGGPGRRQVILFASPTCHLCEALAPSLQVAARAHDATALMLIDADESETMLAYNAKNYDAPIVAASDLVQRLHIPGTPFVVVLDELGIVQAKGTANNLEQLEGLIDTAIERSHRSQVEWSNAS